MTQPEPIKETASTVRRAERGRDAISQKQPAELTRLVRDEATLQADASTRITALTRRALEPIHRVVEADSAAKAAIAELRERRIAEFERQTGAGAARTFHGPGVATLIPHLHAGINVFGPPYDFDVRGPNNGEVAVSANRTAGTCSINLNWGMGGARFATAGVGLALEAGVTGVAHVRPAWQYQYQAIAYGSLLGSHTEGAGRVVVQDAISGAVLKDVTRALWHFDNDRWEDSDGYIDSWGLGVDCFLQGGQMFTVSFLATGMVDDSGTDFLFGWSLAKASLTMKVPFVVVELGP